MDEDDKWIIALMIVAIITVVGLLAFTVVRDDRGMTTIEQRTNSTSEVSD